MATLVEHARVELALLGEESGMAACLTATVGAFASYGHSGGSAECALPILWKLLHREALTPLTCDPAEWEDRSAFSSTPMWQNVRDGRAFSGDAGRTYTLIDTDTPEMVHHAVSPPGWIEPLRERGLALRQAEAAVRAYLDAGPIDGVDQSALDGASAADRRRYMIKRWKAAGAPVAELLYRPAEPGIELTV